METRIPGHTVETQVIPLYIYIYMYTYSSRLVELVNLCQYIYIYMSVDQYYCFWKWFLRGLLLSFRGTFALTFAQHV